MLINILSTSLDEIKLNKEISEFEFTNEKRACLFINDDTVKELTSAVLDKNSNPNGRLCSYNARDVYIDNNLKFGEVEIK